MSTTLCYLSKHNIPFEEESLIPQGKLRYVFQKVIGVSTREVDDENDKRDLSSLQVRSRREGDVSSPTAITRGFVSRGVFLASEEPSSLTRLYLYPLSRARRGASQSHGGYNKFYNLPGHNPCVTRSLISLLIKCTTMEACPEY